jgi:putative NADH-flavin reductase
VELTRKFIIAVKAAKLKYFIMVGGTGSLALPDRPFTTACEDMRFWLAYRRAIADSEAHVAYMEERLGSIGSKLRAYRNARVKERAGQSSDETRNITTEYEEAVLRGDPAADFVYGARASFMFFDGNASFRWTFVSPSALYRPGKRTGKYEAVIDELPLKPEANGKSDLEGFDGRLRGISAADLAIAIADEAESQKLVGKHWTAWADLSNDTPHPSYVRL